MRIEPNPTRLVIVPTGASERAAPRRPFGALLQRPQHLSAKEAQALLSAAWTAVVGEAPSRGTAQLLTAHWALETDAGRAMPGHNFAGIKAGPTAQGAFFDTNEGHGATRRELSARFRVYDSPEAGARDYLKLLVTRYPAALEAARVGDTTDFARALAAGGYFTADPVAYSAGLRQRRANIEQNTISLEARVPAAVPASLAEAALGGLLHAFRGASDDS
jgi:Mannosyl-glycoprotein endo-beta-N-acetylglucosaminidase